MFKLITIIIAKITPPPIPDQELVSIQNYLENRAVKCHSNRRWLRKRWVKWFHVWCSDKLQGFWRSSCVSDLSSALQALEVCLPQDAVDLQVGYQVRRANQFWGVAWAEGTTGAHNTPTATAHGCIFWTNDAAAALTVGWLKWEWQN